MEKSALEKEFDFFLEHQAELVKEYNGKYIVIKDQKILGAYDDQLEAVEETLKVHALGTFIVQLCTPGSEAYSLTFYTGRVVFA